MADISIILEGLGVIASAGFLFAIYYSLRLAREAEYDRWWLLMALGAFGLSASQWTSILEWYHVVSSATEHILSQVAFIAGTLLMTLAFYGLYRSMARIRRSVEDAEGRGTHGSSART